MSKHTRSQQSQLRREQRSRAKEFMWQNSFQDPLHAETINLVTFGEVIVSLNQHFGQVIPSAIPSAAFSGCVLSDSRGQGDFQQVKCPHSEAVNCDLFPNCQKCSVFQQRFGGGKGN